MILSFLLTFAALAAEPKTLHCDLSYSYLDANDGFVIDETVKPFRTKLKADEFYFKGARKILTGDGRFDISIVATEPYAKERRELGHKRSVMIAVTDKRTLTQTISGDFMIRPRNKDEDTAYLNLMPESQDDKPANGLNIGCELK